MVLTVPQPTKEPRQRSLNHEDLYLTRYIYPWARPTQGNAELWRWWVFNEPIAMICRETLIANILSLDWEISPKKSEDRDELKGTISHYTDLFNAGGDFYHGMDWTGFLEWILTDLQDLSFGAGAEIGRRGDEPGGRVFWIRPLDGGTLYPTLNRDWPVVQYYNTQEIVAFPRHAIARMYMSPRPELLREGWGLAPPEKIYFALLMLYHGDRYYADLLLDSPPAGILDLGDMDKDSAFEWIEAYRNLLLNKQTAFKIPVLYEHTTKTEFISFGKVPNDIMYDKITMKYAAIIAAGYGMTLSDLGLQATTSAGQTLAGNIRDERKTKRTGYARAKKKVKYFLESILPKTLEFNFIDLDDELNVSLGRARLANATANKIWIENKMFSPAELRLQALQEGIITVSLPEEPPKESEFPKITPAQERPGLLGNPQNATAGGQGEVKASTVVEVVRSKNFESHLKRFVGDLTNSIGSVITESKQGLSDDELYLLRSMVDSSLFSNEDALGLIEIVKAQWDGKRWFQLKAEGLDKELEQVAIESAEKVLRTKFESGEDFDLEARTHEVVTELHGVDWKSVADKFKDVLNDRSKLFLGKSAVYILKDLLLSEYTFDTEQSDGYDLVDKVYQTVSENLNEFVSASVGLETENLVNEIVKEILG